MGANSPSQTKPANNVPALDFDIDIPLPLIVDAASSVRQAPVAAGAVVLLDPKSINIPPTPNRLPESFTTEEFAQLRESIKASGGNVEPILVREVAGSLQGFVLIFGERRLRACLAEHIPVLAMLAVSGDDTSDYLKRMQENLGAATLSPWEFGLQVRHLMLAAPEMTRVKLAEDLGVSVAKISRAYDLGGLPEAIVGAFASPSEIRIKDMKQLRDAWETAPEAVEQEVARIRDEVDPIKGPEIVRRLGKAAKAAGDAFAPCKPPSKNSVPQTLTCGDRTIGQWLMNQQGIMELHIDIAMSELQRTALLHLVSSFAERKVLARPKAKPAKVDGVAATSAAESKPPILTVEAV